LRANAVHVGLWARHVDVFVLLYGKKFFEGGYDLSVREGRGKEMEGRLTVNATDPLQPSRTDNERPAKAAELPPVISVWPIAHKMNFEI
jgi:hypothetical protein